MDKITSLSNPLIKKIASLKETKNIKRHGLFIIEGDHLIQMCDHIEFLFSSDEKLLSKFDSHSKFVVTDEILKKISTLNSVPKIIGVAKIKENDEKFSNKIIYLDGVQDPGNLGTILRTALAFNFKDILLSNECANFYNSKVINSSEGSIFKLNVKNSNIEEIKNLKKEGYVVISTALCENSIKIDELLELKLDKYIIIFGNEGNGVSKEILDLSDYKIIIPIDNIDSLNVGIAAGITLYEIKKHEK